ncbi:MAG TPA: hypothetical protein VKP52_10115 [Pseudolabrys sp.]|jgi:hypothetical protein|nr:hypothetical protein [Pseudolabrys sp.]
MIFFSKRELTPVERFEIALKDRQAAREKLTERLGGAEAVLGDKRAAAETLAITGASDAKLDRAEVDMRAAEDRVGTLRAALAQVDEKIATTERELADAKAQRAREAAAVELETLAAAIEQATPNYDAAAMALIDAIVKSTVSMSETTSFVMNVDAVRREVLSAAHFICAELRVTAARTRAGNANAASASSQPEPPPPPEIERETVYSLDPLLWRENGKVRRVRAFAQVGLPKRLLAVALRHQHVDYLRAQRVQSLMQVYGSGQSHIAPPMDDSRLIDLDDLVAQDKSAKVNAA